MKILLVDDHPELRSATRALLENASHTVVEAPAAAEALVVFHSHADIDLLLTDLHMPGPLDGLELAQRLRAQRPTLPVLLASSDPDRLDTSSLPGVGAAAALAKPFAADTLLHQVEELLRPGARTSPPPRATHPDPTTQAPPTRAPRTATGSSPTRPMLALAALLVVALAAGLLWRQSAPPELPPPPDDPVRRGAVIEAVAPSGPIADAPRALRWRSDAAATHWRVEVRDALDTVVLEHDLKGEPDSIAGSAPADTRPENDTTENSPTENDTTELMLPDPVRAALEPYTAYYWRVVGLDGERTVASSDSIRFRIIPRDIVPRDIVPSDIVPSDTTFPPSDAPTDPL